MANLYNLLLYDFLLLIAGSDLLIILIAGSGRRRSHSVACLHVGLWHCGCVFATALPGMVFAFVSLSSFLFCLFGGALVLLLPLRVGTLLFPTFSAVNLNIAYAAFPFFWALFLLSLVTESIWLLRGGGDVPEVTLSADSKFDSHPLDTNILVVPKRSFAKIVAQTNALEPFSLLKLPALDPTI